MAKNSVANPRRTVKLQHPEKFIGKRVPRNYDWDGYMVGDFALCDDCQRLFRIDDMHALLQPQTQADAELQRKLHTEEAQSYCPDCLTKLEREADAIDPEWRVRHGLARPFAIEETSIMTTPTDYTHDGVTVDNTQIGVFVTPDGKMVSASHGEHSFTVEVLVEQYGEESLVGMVILLDNGNWIQEGISRPLTNEQFEALDMMAAGYPGGVGEAASDALAYFQGIQPIDGNGAILQALRTVKAHMAARDSFAMTAAALGVALTSENEQVSARMESVK